MNPAAERQLRGRPPLRPRPRRDRHPHRAHPAAGPAPRRSRSSATSGATSCSPPNSSTSCGGQAAHNAPPRNASPGSSRPDCSNASDPSPAAAPTPGSTSSAPKATRLLQHAGQITARQRYERRDVYDYTYVLHDLHLNSWVLAYRRAPQGQPARVGRRNRHRPAAASAPRPAATR